MKAQFFNKPLNYTLNIQGDAWEQGSSVKGDLTITNTSKDATDDLTKHGVHLCYCQSKKLKAKDATGIRLIESMLMAEGQSSLGFNFTLDINSPITDSTGSLQILTGDIEDPLSCGLIELKIIPFKVFSSFIEVFETFYRFKFKALKNKKGYIEAQVSPPATKEWAKIQKMILQFKMDEKDLIVTCLINIKVLSFDDSLNKTKDEKKEIILTITDKEHSIYGSVNQAGIQKHITSMLEQIKLKPIL